jgi:hypothetical protein
MEYGGGGGGQSPSSLQLGHGRPEQEWAREEWIPFWGGRETRARSRQLIAVAHFAW